ncbi:MAG: helix-turn-helix transcriptional regulator [Sedimentitalea sp.]
MTPSPDLNSADRLIAQVGRRVRHLREAKHLPRRVLSEMSGVSPRYLAQLEAGQGNISIGLLFRVATALDCEIDALIGTVPQPDAQALDVARLFQAATAQTQAKVLETLSAASARAPRARRICLVGLRGAGKSTLGAMVGKALDVPFVELNREIQDHSGMPVDEVMALYGPEGYRDLEAQAIARVVERYEAMVLAVAGGIVAAPDTYATVLSRFHTVWIKTSPEEHMARVRAQGDERPMAGNPEAMAQLHAILAGREPLYAQAEAHLDTSGCSVKASLAELLHLIRDQGFAEPA